MGLFERRVAFRRGQSGPEDRWALVVEVVEVVVGGSSGSLGVSLRPAELRWHFMRPPRSSRNLSEKARKQEPRKRAVARSARQR